MKDTKISDMVGLVMASVAGDVGDDEMVFTSRDGRVFKFYHSQDCCENVQIEDVCGELSDLVGYPLAQAEEASNEPEPESPGGDSHTWTFYKFATARGAVTVRWLGESNGYYSESVDFCEVDH
jgi:hypothetical protein